MAFRQKSVFRYQQGSGLFCWSPSQIDLSLNLTCCAWHLKKFTVCSQQLLWQNLWKLVWQNIHRYEALFRAVSSLALLWKLMQTNGYIHFAFPPQVIPIQPGNITWQQLGIIISLFQNANKQGKAKKALYLNVPWLIIWVQLSNNAYILASLQNIITVWLQIKLEKS